ncbi:MAG TPA: helix-turn-helix transcriptional regulator [Solirubrobacteraceae bacterium]|nr:helix-turn-helix transcriptional regulator [Solirubrobacteraceae bacterium]
MELLYKEFGSRLRTRRKAAKLTQGELAERVGLTRTSITNIEAGRQHVVLHQLFLLASNVGAEPHELLPRERTTLEELISAPKTLKAIRPQDREAITKVLNTARASEQKETPTT